MGTPAQIRLSELAGVASRVKTGAAVLDASAAWARAPASIKMMAGAYVAPLMAAIIAINDELQGLQNGR